MVLAAATVVAKKPPTVASTGDAVSQPELHPFAQLRRQSSHHRFLDQVRRIAGAEVHRDDQFVLEPVGPLDVVVQMEVAVLVNLLTLMFRPKKRQLGDKNLG